MKNRRNYYRILHVQPDAPAAIIKSSYRTLMQKLRVHPDLGGDDWNASLINEAFSVVMDPVRRASYDADLGFHARGCTPGSEARADGPRPAPSEPQGYGAQPQRACAFCQTPHLPSEHYGSEDVCPHCMSPLTPPQRIELEGPCQRAVSRIAREGAVQIFTRWPPCAPCPGLIIDLSTKGAGITTPLALPAGALIKVDGNLFTAVARVVNCLDKTEGTGRIFHLGTEFVTLAFAQMRGTFVSARI